MKAFCCKLKITAGHVSNHCHKVSYIYLCVCAFGTSYLLMYLEMTIAYFLSVLLYILFSGTFLLLIYRACLKNRCFLGGGGGDVTDGPALFFS